MNKREIKDLLVIKKAPSKHPIYKNYHKCSSHLIEGYVVYIEPTKHTTAVTYPKYDTLRKVFNWYSYALDDCCTRSSMELTLKNVFIGGEDNEIEELCSLFNIPIENKAICSFSII